MKMNSTANGKYTVSRFLVFFISCWLLFSCEEEKKQTKEEYKGPLSTVINSTINISDSAIIVARITTPKEDRFENGDREWAEGLMIETFRRTSGKSVSLLQSKYAFYNKQDNLYKATDSVVVKSLENGDQLRTEELFWDPQKREFFTEKYVTIETEDEVHTGDGLRAAEDFSYYRITHPKGTLTVEEFKTSSDSTTQVTEEE